MKKVKQEHKQFEIEKLQIMLNAVGLNLSYQEADLISRVVECMDIYTLTVDEFINTLTVDEVINIKRNWLKDYENQDLYVEI